jgi:hypothetical protein
MRGKSSKFQAPKTKFEIERSPSGGWRLEAGTSSLKFRSGVSAGGNKKTNHPFGRVRFLEICFHHSLAASRGCLKGVAFDLNSRRRLP